MKTPLPFSNLIAGSLLASALSTSLLHAQPRQQAPQVTSPEVSAERKITFRIHAPKAEAVQLGGSGDTGVLQQLAAGEFEAGHGFAILDSLYAIGGKN